MSAVESAREKFERAYVAVDREQMRAASEAVLRGMIDYEGPDDEASRALKGAGPLRSVLAVITRTVWGLAASAKLNLRAAHAEIDALKRRIADLESRQKGFCYRGVFDERDSYEPNNFVTHQGSMWHTNARTSARPGAPGSPWQLCVKRGKDAMRNAA